MNFKDRGERIAAKHLQGLGYKILAHNFIGRNFEIDLIVRKKDLVVFVEVKRRTATNFMYPVEGVDRKKRINIIKGAKYYLVKNDLYDKVDVRFDVVTVRGNEEQLEHYKDAFRNC